MERRITHHNDTRQPLTKKLIREDGNERSVLWLFSHHPASDFAVLIETASEDSLGNKRWTEAGRYYSTGKATTIEGITARLLRGDA